MEKTKFEFILGQEADVIQAFAEGPMPEQFSEEQTIAQSIVAMGDLVQGVPHRIEEKTIFEKVLNTPAEELEANAFYKEFPHVNECEEKEALFCLEALFALMED